MELTYSGKIDPQALLRETPLADVDNVVSFGQHDHDWANRLYYGDNLPVLKSLYQDEAFRGKVQLIYIDPPYGSQQTFRHRKKLVTHAYDDTLVGARFIEFLRQRLIFLHQLLATNGAIYVHLDSNMAFHVKVIMDEIFGEQNFRNWITRKKCHSKNYTTKSYGNVADYILFYSKSAEMKWHRPYEAENIYTFDQRFPKRDPRTGRRHALVPIHAPGVRNGETGKPWRGMMPPAGKHWQVTPKELDRLDAAGEIYWSPTGNPRRKIFADNDRGVVVQDIWTKFMDFRNQNMNDTGYPTEKNVALLRRIIEASSDPGDLVLDCFCGSGTTLVVARDLGRRWIGVDNSSLAIRTSTERLRKPPKSSPASSAGEESSGPNTTSIVARNARGGPRRTINGALDEGPPFNPETFWEASHKIVAEAYAILKPGGYAVWITKAFVRKKQIVDFPGDWRRLCETCGFETVKEVHATFVYTNRYGKLCSRKSFFRRLAEAKGSPPIDYEVVWIMRKAAPNGAPP